MTSTRMIVFLLIVASVCTLLLAGAEMAYQRAAEKFAIQLYADILEVFDIPAAEGEVERVFHQHFETRTFGDRTYYISKTVQPATVVFKASGAGLWGPIELLLAVGPDRRELMAMRVLAQSETPGLGGRITEPEFQRQFRGVDIRPEIKIVKFASMPNEVDAVTGASKTGEALQRIINNAVDQMDSDLQE